nr:glycoside hydrolase family 3 C-terminal domain-containing protein [Oscillospiraceae bacterium]
MSKIWEKIYTFGAKIGEKFTNGVSQEEALKALGEPTVTKGMPEILRKAAAETCVLLKNDGTLPYSRDSIVSVFGRNQIDWFFTGYGSGGDVKIPYGKNLIDGLKECGIKFNTELADTYAKWSAENTIDHGVWGMWPRFYPDMALTPEIVKAAAEKSSDAIFIIGRSSGEDRENVLEKGSYYITDEEKQNLTLITEYFDKVTVLLNIGSVIDMSVFEELNDKIGAILIVWQGGMESGTGVADVLCGNVTPCGKLPDTIAKDYNTAKAFGNFGKKAYNEYTEDIYVGYRGFEADDPTNVVYPFGFGLSYTKFKIEYEDAEILEDSVKFTVSVTNTGDRCGKE